MLISLVSLRHLEDKTDGLNPSRYCSPRHNSDSEPATDDTLFKKRKACEAKTQVTILATESVVKTETRLGGLIDAAGVRSGSPI